MNLSAFNHFILLTLFLQVKTIFADQISFDNNELIIPTEVHFEIPTESPDVEKWWWQKYRKYIPTISFNFFVIGGIKLRWGGYAFENKIGFDQNNYKLMTNVVRNDKAFWTIVNLTPLGDYSVQMQVHTRQGIGHFIYNLTPAEVNDQFVNFYNAAKYARASYTSQIFKHAGILKEKLGLNEVLLLSRFTGILKIPKIKAENALEKENAQEMKSNEDKSPEKNITTGSSSQHSFKTASEGSLENSNENKSFTNVQLGPCASTKRKTYKKGYRRRRIITLARAMRDQKGQAKKQTKS